MRKLALTVALSAALLLTGGVQAGGYLLDTLGTPYAWSSPVTYNLDLGMLGVLTNAGADTLATNGIGRWANGSVSTCSLSFTQGADLGVDHVAGNYGTTYNVGSDGINPIIYDTDGSITDAVIGVGASAFVVGFAGFTHAAGSTIVDGHAVMNGLFAPPAMTTANYRGVFVHEFGHMLNLEHSQCNEYNIEPGNGAGGSEVGTPTMYPIAFGDGLDTLAADDIAWISNLYPHASFATSRASITGTVRDFSNSLIDGVNLVARSTVNPDSEVVSTVTGNPGQSTGAFEIPGLLPNHTYTIHYEQIQSGFTGGSSVGPADPQLRAQTVGEPEFLNEAAFEGTADSALHSTTFTTGAAGTTLSGLNLRLNGPAGAASLVSEVDPGTATGNLSTDGHVLAMTPGTPVVFSGTVNDTEVGFWSVGDDIEDWIGITGLGDFSLYNIEFSPVGPGGPFILLVCEDLGGSLTIADGVTGLATGSTTIFDQHFESSTFGTGGGADRIFIGVAAAGVGANTYAIRLETRTGDTGQVQVTGTANSQLDIGFPGTPNSHRITGQGFSATGGPIVTTSDPNILVGAVTFNSSTSIDVDLSDAGAFTPGSTTLTVTNAGGVGGYSGSITAYPSVVPVELSVFTSE